MMYVVTLEYSEWPVGVFDTMEKAQKACDGSDWESDGHNHWWNRGGYIITILSLNAELKI